MNIEKTALLLIKKQHLVIMALIAMATPAATGAYTSSSAAAMIDTKFEARRAEVERDFVRKDSMQELVREVKEMNTRLGRIEGRLEAQSLRGR